MNRRTIVKAGLGVPVLPALAAAEASAEVTTSDSGKVKTSKNVLFLCLDFGFMRNDLFYGEGEDCKSPYFDVLDDIKGKYTFFKNTHQPNLLNSSHKAHPAALTCVKSSQRSIYALESIDQYIGRMSLRETRHRTAIFCTSGIGRVCWNSSAQRVPGISDIRKFHDSLFGEVDTTQETAEANGQLELLSRALGEVKRKASTPADELLALSLEVRVQELREDLHWIQKGAPNVNVEFEPSEISDNRHAQLPEALRLCVEAFRCKQTKVATVYFDGSGHVALPGVKSGYHGLSHKPRNDEALVQREIVDRFVLDSIVGHVKDLESKGILDETLVVVSGAMGNPASHSNRSLPVFLMGGGLNHQGVVECMEDKKLVITLADVYQTVVSELGLPAMNLPYCEGAVKEVLS